MFALLCFFVISFVFRDLVRGWAGGVPRVAHRIGVRRGIIIVIIVVSVIVVVSVVIIIIFIIVIVVSIILVVMITIIIVIVPFGVAACHATSRVPNMLSRPVQ